MTRSMRYGAATGGILLAGVLAFVLASGSATDEAPRAAEPPAAAPPPAPPERRPAEFARARCPRVYARYALPGLRCLQLTVPADHWAQERGRVRLMVVRMGRTSGPRDPLLIVPGGPGGTLEPYLQLFATSRTLRERLLGTREVLVLDARGSGGSRPALHCRTPRRAADAVQANVACAEQLERRVDDLGLFDSRQSAVDIGAIARATDPEGIDVYAASWGTRVVLEAMAIDGEGLKDVVLDGVVPADENLFTSRASNLEESLEAIEAGCRRQARCRRMAPDLGKDLDRLGRRYGDVLAPGLTDLLASRYSLPTVPGLVHRAAEGNVGPLARRLSQAFRGRSPVSDGAYLSGVCRDRSAATAPRKVALSADSVSPLAAAAARSAAEDRDACVVWPVDPDTRRSAATEGIDHRALLLAGLYDPITPPSDARHAMLAFENAQLVILRHASHTVLDTSCGLKLITAFLDDGLKPRQTKCARRELTLR